MNIMVTGGAGFIGSHVVEHLISNHHHAIVVDNLSTGNPSNLTFSDDFSFIQKDINDCNESDFPTNIYAVIHLCASPSVSDSWENMKATHQNNLTSTISVLTLCRSLGIRKVVFASSAAVYGNIENIPIRESSSTQPISPYGLHKLMSEHYLSMYAKALNISVVILRFFNVFGPRQNPNSQYSGVITKFIGSMQAGRPITIFGTGEQSRDFVFVKDVAWACCESLNIPSHKEAVILNIGTGKMTSIKTLAECLSSMFPQWNKRIIQAEAQPGDILFSLSDISMAGSILNYKPEFSLEAGLKTLLKDI